MTEAAGNGHRPSGDDPGRRRSVRSYEDLDAWQMGIDLAEAVYDATRRFPAEETFGLQSQMRRASVAIASNIAEGWGRNSRNDYVRFLRIARGSLYELKTQVEIARRVGLLDPAASDDLRERADRNGRVLHGLIQSLAS